MSDLIAVESVGPYVRIAPRGQLTSQNAARLRQEMVAQIAEEGPQLVVDFSAVEFMDSMALGAIANTAVVVRERLGKLLLCSMNPSVRRVFEITQMHRVLDIVPDLETAMSRLVDASPASAGAA